MARKPKPWFRTERNMWCVTINGVQHNLGQDKKEAETEFHKLMAEPPEVIVADSVVGVFDLFLDWTQKNRSQGSYDWYAQRLNEFSNRVKTLRVGKLTPLHVQEWVDTKSSDGHTRL